MAFMAIHATFQDFFLDNKGGRGNFHQLLNPKERLTSNAPHNISLNKNAKVIRLYKMIKKLKVLLIVKQIPFVSTE